jgi:BMFP domain-containing protein YqiC
MADLKQGKPGFGRSACPGVNAMTDSASPSPLHWLQGIASELEGIRTVTVQRLSQRLGLPSREDFEVQRALLEDARERLAAVQAQVEALAARFDSKP